MYWQESFKFHVLKISLLCILLFLQILINLIFVFSPRLFPSIGEEVELSLICATRKPGKCLRISSLKLNHVVNDFLYVGKNSKRVGYKVWACLSWLDWNWVKWIHKSKNIYVYKVSLKYCLLGLQGSTNVWIINA